MKTRAEVTADKLRGGFYTPPSLVAQTIQRAVALCGDRNDLRVLEPSAGDGAFILGLVNSGLAGRVTDVTAVELIAHEAEACRDAFAEADLPGRVVNDDFIAWRSSNDRVYDAAIGNPPFVRFQFVDDDTKALAADLAVSLDLEVRRVSNLWIPVLLGALSRLRDGGAFAFVIPAECFTGVSAGAVRIWLMRHCEKVTFDLFPPGSFPDVLQEVVILSGRRRSLRREVGTLRVVEHEANKEWTQTVPATADTWTRYLLEPAQLGALSEAAALPQVRQLGRVAKFEVAAVTGANDFFSVDAATLEEHGLHAWATPLLPRIRHAPGLVYAEADHAGLVAKGANAALLDFSSDRPDPAANAGATAYLRSGEEQGIHRRYKTRIRSPWYRVPYVRSEPMMLSKRSHRYPRVVLNEVGAVTTDTIYRGRLADGAPVDERDFVAAFHNSLTLLTAEVEGRSFGGGVLELVPSEVARLRIPVVPGFGAELPRFDAVVRECESLESDSLVEETNVFLTKASFGLTSELLDQLEAGRRRLASRRLSRG